MHLVNCWNNLQSALMSDASILLLKYKILCHIYMRNSSIFDIRFGDERTYEVSCAGIQKHGTIAVGSHGCIKLLSDRSYFVSGLEYVVSRLEPSTLVVYGAAPDKIFAPYREKGIEVLQFDSDFMKSRKAVSA